MDARTAHAVHKHALQHGNAKIQQQNIIRILIAVSIKKLTVLMGAQMGNVQFKHAIHIALSAALTMMFIGLIHAMQKKKRKKSAEIAAIQEIITAITIVSIEIMQQKHAAQMHAPLLLKK